MKLCRGFILAAFLGLLLLSPACIEDDATEVSDGSSITEALSADAGSVVRVSGWLLGPRNAGIPRLCTELRQPDPYVLECVDPSIPVLVNLDMVDGVRRMDAYAWVAEVIQLEGVIVRPDGRESELDVYGCVEQYSEKCKLPDWHRRHR